MPYTPAQDLAGKHPLDTRTLLVTTDGSQLFMGDGNLITTLNISSITSSVVTESIFQSSIVSASTAVRIGAYADEFAHLYVSGSPGLVIAEFDNSAGSEVLKITSAGYTVIKSGSFTGSLFGTSSATHHVLNPISDGLITNEGTQFSIVGDEWAIGNNDSAGIQVGAAYRLFLDGVVIVNESIYMSGSGGINAAIGGFTGSLQGTSSRAVSSSHAGSSSHAVVAAYTNVSPQGAGQYNVALLGSNSGYANVYADSNSDMLYDVSTNTLTVPFTFTTASYAGTASYVSASAIVGGVTNQFHFISQSFTTMSFVNGILTSFV